MEESWDENNSNIPTNTPINNPKKRGAEESFGIETFGSLTESNFGEFLKSRKTIFKPDKLREIWKKLSYQLGEGIEKEHIKELTEQELKEMDIPIGVIKQLIIWSKEINLNENESFQALLENDNPMEFDVDMITKELNKFGVIWVSPKKGLRSRENWKEYEKRKTRKQTLYEWRNEFQIERSIDPLKLVKHSSFPFPRLISIPENGRIARITVKGKENDNDLFEGNIAHVNQQLREADFINFQVKKCSYKEGWIFKFEVLDDNRNVIESCETNLLQVASHRKQITLHILRIDKLVPPKGEIYAQHDVTLYGYFKYDPTLKVYFGGEAKSFVWKTEVLLASGVSSNIPQQVPVYIQSQTLKSNEVLFTFFNSDQLRQEMGLSILSNQSNSNPILSSFEKTNSFNQHSFIMNNGQTNQFPVNKKCSYPSFFFDISSKYKIEELETIRDYRGFNFLHWSCGQGDLNLTEFFIENGFNINFRDYFGGTPLHWAVWSQSEDVISYLKSKGAKFDIEDFYEISPQFLLDEIERMKNEKLFRESCFKGDLNTIKGLIMKKRINMLSQDQNGKTGFDLAFENQHQIILDFLFNNSEYLNQSNNPSEYLNNEDPMEISNSLPTPQSSPSTPLNIPMQSSSPTKQPSPPSTPNPKGSNKRSEEEIKKFEEEKESFKNFVGTQAFITKTGNQIKGDNKPRILYFFKSEKIWELFAPNNEWIEWKEFRKRCYFVSTENIVYLQQNGIIFLNVSSSYLRGAKKWLTDDEKHERILKSKFIKILKYFEPIVCCPSRYKKIESFGFTLSIIFQTLSFPSFAGPTSSNTLEGILKESYVGDHRFRFSSSDPLSFTLVYKSKIGVVKPLRFTRYNIEGIEIGYETELKHKFLSLLDFEEKLEKNPSLASELGIEWKAASSNPQEVLDEEEKKLYQFLKEKKLDYLYPNLINGQGVYVDSLEQLRATLSDESQREQLKLNFDNDEDYAKLCSLGSTL